MTVTVGIVQYMTVSRYSVGIVQYMTVQYVTVGIVKYDDCYSRYSEVR